jgi:hypothetical protein
MNPLSSGAASVLSAASFTSTVGWTRGLSFGSEALVRLGDEQQSGGGTHRSRCCLRAAQSVDLEVDMSNSME